MMHEMLSHVQEMYEKHVKKPKLSTQIDILLEGVRSKQYQPLMTRTRCGRLLPFYIFGLLKNVSFIHRKFGKSNSSFCQKETN